jgi:hypothetical protein
MKIYLFYIMLNAYLHAYDHTIQYNTIQPKESQCSVAHFYDFNNNGCILCNEPTYYGSMMLYITMHYFCKSCKFLLYGIGL